MLDSFVSLGTAVGLGIYKQVTVRSAKFSGSYHIFTIDFFFLCYFIKVWYYFVLFNLKLTMKPIFLVIFSVLRICDWIHCQSNKNRWKILSLGFLNPPNSTPQSWLCIYLFQIEIWCHQNLHRFTSRTGKLLLLTLLWPISSNGNCLLRGWPSNKLRMSYRFHWIWILRMNNCCSSFIFVGI